MNRLLRLASQMWIARIVRWQNKKRRLRVLVMTADAGKTMHYLKTITFMKLTVSAASGNPRKIHAILFSPDITVVVLAITNYDTLPRRATTTMTTLTGCGSLLDLTMTSSKRCGYLLIHRRRNSTGRERVKRSINSRMGPT